jgi:hypothetical protein
MRASHQRLLSFRRQGGLKAGVGIDDTPADAMHKINGKTIHPVRRGGVDGHVLRAHSGVKVATFYGDDSLERAMRCAGGRSHRGA